MTQMTTEQRAQILNIPTWLMEVAERTDNYSIDYWIDMKKECERQGEDFCDIMYALYRDHIYDYLFDDAGNRIDDDDVITLATRNIHN